MTFSISSAAGMDRRNNHARTTSGSGMGRVRVRRPRAPPRRFTPRCRERLHRASGRPLRDRRGLRRWRAPRRRGTWRPTGACIQLSTCQCQCARRVGTKSVQLAREARAADKPGLQQACSPCAHQSAKGFPHQWDALPGNPRDSNSTSPHFSQRFQATAYATSSGVMAAICAPARFSASSNS